MTPFETCLAALQQPGSADILFQAVDKALAEVVGHKLFTLLYVAPNGKRVKRLYTNMPKEYPVGGYKEVTESGWHKRVIGERRVWVGYDYEDVKWAFFDHELIRSLGCESSLNQPIVYAGRVLAVAIVKQLKKNDQFTADFNDVKAELAAAQAAAKN